MAAVPLDIPIRLGDVKHDDGKSKVIRLDHSHAITHQHLNALCYVLDFVVSECKRGGIVTRWICNNPTAAPFPSRSRIKSYAHLFAIDLAIMMMNGGRFDIQTVGAGRPGRPGQGLLYRVDFKSLKEVEEKDVLAQDSARRTGRVKSRRVNARRGRDSQTKPL